MDKVKKIIWLLTLFYYVNCEESIQISRNVTRKRQFGLLSVVQFPNDECTTATDNSVKGVCMSAEDCGKNSGTEDGKCASGFGVCCMFRLTACGGTVSQNISYIQNPEYPSKYSDTTSCTYTVNSVSDGICQLRLDFDTLVVADPSTTTPITACTTDTVKFESPSGYDPPTVCGVITGAHLYMETASSTTAATITFTFSTTTTSTRKWNIKVSQIPCHSNYKAPPDCAQYYTGPSGAFTSLNYNMANDASALIQSALLYRICFRKERGYCSIIYGANTVSSTIAAYSFLPGTVAKQTHSGCRRGFISIKGGRDTEQDQYCGVYLSNTKSDQQNGNIHSDIAPFGIDVATASDDSPTKSASFGFSLSYFQQPCGNHDFGGSA